MRNHTRSAVASLILLPLATVVACASPTGEAEDTSSLTADLSIAETRGVDSASAFSAADAKTLKDDHGVEWTGVYIGGKCSGGSGWVSSSHSMIASDWVMTAPVSCSVGTSPCGLIFR